LLPAMAASVSWSVSDTSVAFITTAEDGTGVLEGLQAGRTRVILSVDGVERDYSGQVLVLSSSTSSSGSSGGGCGTTLPPAGDPWSGFPEMVLIAITLLVLRWRKLAEVSPMSKAQSSKR
ncbi:hypothetical protein MUP29_03440, partial [bacterium]|nr:hypothetical protein [bacterium]